MVLATVLPLEQVESRSPSLLSPPPTMSVILRPLPYNPYVSHLPKATTTHLQHHLESQDKYQCLNANTSGRKHVLYLISDVGK